MKHLQTVQKTFHVFLILAKIAKTLHYRRIVLRCHRSVRRNMV